LNNFKPQIGLQMKPDTTPRDHSWELVLTRAEWAGNKEDIAEWPNEIWFRMVRKIGVHFPRIDIFHMRQRESEIDPGNDFVESSEDTSGEIGVLDVILLKCG
jgi:hypothetical protein